MLPKLPPVPDGILIEKVDTIPTAPSYYDWLYARLETMKPGDQPYRITFPNKKPSIKQSIP